NLPLTPETVGHSSCKPVWWRCEKGHCWQTQVSSRAAGFTGCPRCNEERMAEKRRRRQAETVSR
ncbi:MAG: zinc-ribbon domain-containing protein, partial [Oscillospiraceae bacterium]